MRRWMRVGASVSLAAVARCVGDARGASSELPLVDAGELEHLDTQAVEQLLLAARGNGIARLANHQLDVGAARKAGWDYFRLPMELKDCAGCSLRNATVGLQRGYIPVAGESGLADILEQKEGFSYGYEWPSTKPAGHPYQVGNVWPPAEALGVLGEGWQRTMMEVFETGVRLSRAVVNALAETLGEAGSELPGLCADGETISQMRMFHYMPAPSTDGKTCMGSSPHTDWHLVTIIVRDAESTLQYMDRATGDWVNATTQAGELVLLIGDWLSHFSQAEFHSPAHRVLAPERQSSLAFVLFFYPSVHARLQHCLAGQPQADAERLNTVEASMCELPWGDYVVQKWAKVMSNR